MDKTLIFEIVSFILSLVAIVISFLVYFQTNRHNKIAIKKDYFDKIFLNLIVEDFPINIIELSMSGNKFNHIQLDKLHEDSKTLIKKMSILNFLSFNNNAYKEIKSAFCEVQNKIFDLYDFDVSDLNSLEKRKQIELKKEELQKTYSVFFELFSKNVFQQKIF